MADWTKETNIKGPPGTTEWDGIANKPATFPPTLPIAESDVTNLVTDLAAKQATSAKGQANGYASLDATSKVPAAQLPSYVDDVLEFANLAAFPATGTAGIIYIALDTNKVYRWGGSSYTEISPSPGSTDAVPEGSTNKYYTDARAQAANATAIALKVAKAGDTMTGDLTISKAGPSLIMDKPAAGTSALLAGRKGGVARWDMQFGNATAESGSNAGSDFAINAYSDAGAYIFSPLIIQRANGLATVSADPTAALGISTKQYVDNKIATAASATSVGDVPPSSPKPGQLWYESDSGNTFIWFDDGTSQQWVQVNVPNVSGLSMSQARNRLINGAFQHSQENSVTTVSTFGAYPADQWQLQFNGLAASALQVASNDPTFGPFYVGTYGPGTGKPSLAVADYFQLAQNIEGRRIYDFYWGQPSARPIVVRFNANASVAGTYACVIRNAAATRSYVTPIAVGTTGKTFVVPIPGCTDGVWPNDNTAGMSLSICAAAGTQFQTTPNQWMPGNFLSFAGMSNLAATASQSFALGQVGLYLDDGSGLPPKWELPDPPTELLACWRYWERVPMTVLPTWTGGLPYGNTAWWKAGKRTPPLITATGAVNGATFDVFNGANGVRQTAFASAAGDVQLIGNARM